MAVVAIVNRKGGSGKSTLATHLAAYCANNGASVLLGDVDRQQSTRTWLSQRNAATAASRRAIASWPVDPKHFARPPIGTDIVVLDTPGGLTGLDLARVVMYADAILMPVGPSIFDRDSAADCLAELRTLPRIAADRCRIGVIGMRLDARTAAAESVRGWASAHGLPLLTVLRETDNYVSCIEAGQTLFDLPADEVADDLAQWRPLLLWLRPLLRPLLETAPVAEDAMRPSATARPIPLREHAPIHAPAPRLGGRAPHQQAAFGRNTVLHSARGAPVPSPQPVPASQLSRLLDALPIPRFLQRSP